MKSIKYIKNWWIKRNCKKSNHAKSFRRAIIDVYVITEWVAMDGTNMVTADVKCGCNICGELFIARNVWLAKSEIVK